MAKSASVVALLRKLSIDSWLRAHGKFVRPELTKKQKQELKECFDLIDLDGSGAIDASELHTAFSVLGMRVKRSEVERMLDEVDEDGSGEVEYPEFVQIMTTKLETQTQEVEEEAKTKVQPLPFQLLAQAYRRKKLMEAVMGGDKAAQERLRAKAEEAEAERLAVLAAMEAEKQDPTLRYDEKSIRTLSDVKYQKLRKAQARKKHIPEGTLPQYVVQNLDEDVKEALIEMNEDPHFIVKSGHPDAKSTTSDVKKSNEDNPVFQPTDVALDEVINVPEEIKPISMSTQIQSLYKDDLIDFTRHRTKVRHKPVLERQMLHLRAMKSIQEFVKTKET